MINIEAAIAEVVVNMGVRELPLVQRRGDSAIRTRSAARKMSRFGPRAVEFCFLRHGLCGIRWNRIVRAVTLESVDWDVAAN